MTQNTFEAFGLHPDLLRGIRDLGWDAPTPIQKDAIPPALAGKDVLACAMTGSGKTAGFALPTLHRLHGKRRGAVRALVIVPTRELAAQVLEQFDLLGKHTPVRGAAIFGGVGMGPQEAALRRGVDVIVATPGRLLDHLQHPYAKLDQVEILVLDEADRMLDMGFLPDIKRVLAHLPKGPRQTLFFSATMPGPIGTLARELLHHPVTINIERKAAPATGVEQTIYPVSEDLKVDLLVELLRREDIRNAIAFTRTKHRANRLAEFLDKAGISCQRIHGNRSQGQRTLALDDFKKGRTRVLVATDIAQRGIDIDELSHVINFDVPLQPEDYIHRVGRTARAGATGDAITLCAPEEEGELRAIERAVGRKIPRATLPDFDYRAKPRERFEIPIGERIQQIRARKAEERKRAAEKAARKAGRVAEEPRGKAAPKPASHAPKPASHHATKPATHAPKTAPHAPKPHAQKPAAEPPKKRDSGRVTFTPIGRSAPRDDHRGGGGHGGGGRGRR